VEAAVALDLQTALSQYGLVGIYAKNNPEINKILQQAIAGEWDSARFERALWDTSWWKTLSEQHRALDVMRVTDPATFNSTVEAKKAEVRQLASRMGLAVDANHWAQTALRNNWDSATLQWYLATDKRNKLLSVNGGLTGQAGEVEAHVRSLYQAYGMNVPPSTSMSEFVTEILSGGQTLGGIENEVRNRAKQLYPQYAAEIDSGKTISDLAQPYIQTMASVLEISEPTLDVNNAYIKRALQYRDPEGRVMPQPLWEFEKTLKGDWRYQYTKGAHNESYDMLQKIGQDWGLSA
jgi:hypothetical protein